MRRSKLSPEADADLSAIHSHIFDQDPATAALIIDRIEATIASLCVFPQIGKPTTRSNTWVFGGTGKSPFRVTYRFDEEVLIVLRIFRHSRQNVLTLDLSRFDAAPLIAFTATKETNYGTETDGRISR